MLFGRWPTLKQTSQSSLWRSLHELISHGNYHLIGLHERLILDELVNGLVPDMQGNIVEGGVNHEASLTDRDGPTSVCAGNGLKLFRCTCQERCEGHDAKVVSLVL